MNTRPSDELNNEKDPIENPKTPEEKLEAKEEGAMASAIVIGMEETLAESAMGAVTKTEMNVAQSGWRAIFNAIYTTLFTHTTDTKQARIVAGDVDTSKMDFRQKHFVGLKQNMSANLARSAVLFGSLPILQGYFQKNMRPEQHALAELLAFVTASMAEGIAWTPISLANFRIRTLPDIKGYKDALKATPWSDTLRAITKGAFWGGVLRNPMFAGPFYYGLKKGESYFIAPEETHTTRIFKMMAIGAAAGILPAFGSYPFDVIQKKAFKDPQRSSWSILKTIFQEKGVQGFWEGGRLVPIRVGASSAAIAAAIATGDSIAHKHNPASLFRNKMNADSSWAPSEEEVMADLSQHSTRMF